MITIPAGVRIYLACGKTDMRKGFDGLSMLAQDVLKQDPFSGAIFCFRGRRGDLIKILYWDGQGFCLFAHRRSRLRQRRLERGRFIWPAASISRASGTAVDGAVTISPAQLGYMLDYPWECPSLRGSLILRSS